MAYDNGSAWTPAHARTLDDFLRTLAAKGVRYFILRNYHGLPDSNPSKDVDVIVDPKRYRDAKDALLGACRRGGFTRAFVTRFERAHCWYGFDPVNRLSIHIDIISGYSNKGFEYLSFDELYAGTEDHNGYRVMTDPYNCLMLLLYKAVGVHELKPRYRVELAEQYPAHTAEIDGLLERYFGEGEGRKLSRLLAEGDYDGIVNTAAELSHASKVKAFARRPLGTIGGVTYFLAEKADRMVFRPGRYRRIIAVEGPDGTGKSTFIDGLAGRISEVFLVDPSAVVVRHFRPSILPNLGAVGEKAGVMKQDTDFENPHRNAPAGRLSSFLRMGYYWLDYCLGGFVVARRDAQFGSFGIFDRYIYDFLVDPHRSRIELPEGVRRVFARATYRPQVTFVLSASPETVYARKRELEPDEIARQNSEFVKLRHVASGYTEVDAERTPDEMAEFAVWALVEAFTKPIGGLHD